MLVSMIIEAAAFAAHAHRLQRRKDDTTPYINHPIEVAATLAGVGVDDDILMSAAFLHDTLEDTDVSPKAIADQFGADVLRLVLEVSDDKNLPKAVRKAHQIERAPYKSDKAKQLKTADMICNLRSMLEAPPHGWTIERVTKYFDWTRLVQDGISGLCTELDVMFNDVQDMYRNRSDQEVRNWLLDITSAS
jgi:guanosine-3',5'-bis(diphosphate) 3'-pyrophosphohydrolase